MGIYLGNLSVEQIERRSEITLSDEDREYFKANRQANVSKPIEHGKWHCFDIPFMLMVHDKSTAITYRNILEKYDWDNCREVFQIGWESKS